MDLSHIYNAKENEKQDEISNFMDNPLHSPAGMETKETEEKEDVLKTNVFFFKTSPKVSQTPFWCILSHFGEKKFRPKFCLSAFVHLYIVRQKVENFYK